MASYNTVITNEGAALLASVIANQGTLTFSEMRFSTTDYDGVEQTLTVGTFGGVFITAAAAGSVVDATTIKVAAQFDNSGIVGDHPLYSIGIVGTDGNTTALIAVCTTTNPDIIRAALTGVSTYAFNVNLAVSSTSNITVTGTTAAVLYDVDVVDTLISTATDKPLSANMGKKLADEKQDKTLATPITVDGTQETTVEGAFGALNTYSDKIKDNLTGHNLLDNGWFTINQRGFTSHTMDTTYFPTVDRWIGISSDYGGTLTLGASGINFNKEGYASPFYLTQKMEALAVGKTYTLSVLFSDGTIEHGTGIINSTSDKVDFEFSNSRGKAHTYYYAAWSQWLTDIIAYGGTNFTVRAIKLEVGSVSTLHLDVAPDVTLETIKCQRYLYRIRANEATAYIGIGYMNAIDQAVIIFPLPTKLAKNPTVTFSGILTIRIPSGSTATATTITTAYRTSNSIALFINVGASLTAGVPCIAILSTGGDYIDIASDL